MVKQTAGHDALGGFAPEFAHLNDDVLFGEVWSREDKLSLKLRSVVTISALIGKGITDSSLTYHLNEAKKNGVTRTEFLQSSRKHSAMSCRVNGAEHFTSLPSVMTAQALLPTRRRISATLPCGSDIFSAAKRSGTVLMFLAAIMCHSSLFHLYKSIRGMSGLLQKMEQEPGIGYRWEQLLFIWY